MSKGNVMPPNRPTVTSRGSTYFRADIKNEMEEKQYDVRLRCVLCGFINRETVSNCAMCEQENWKGEHK